MTDGSGNASFDVTLGTFVPSGNFVTATATNTTQEQTSEFANGIAVIALTADLDITKTTAATTVNVGQTID